MRLCLKQHCLRAGNHASQQVMKDDAQTIQVAVYTCLFQGLLRRFAVNSASARVGDGGLGIQQGARAAPV
jgi:hypothetical protein